jgi:hypothetical protein
MNQTIAGGDSTLLLIGAWFAELVAPLLDVFANPDLGPALALIILVLGVSIALVFGTRIVQINRRLQQLERLLSRIPDAVLFAQRFTEINEAFERESLTRHGWSELKKSFIWPARESDPISNTARPSRYLNRHEAGLQYRRIQSLPNLFVGLGLLFTFIGLVAALKAANSGISGGDVAATTGSLAKLLGAATAKFYTSIAGLACSILLGFVIRDGLARVDGSFSTLAELLERRLIAATPEHLVSQLLDQAREQTSQLKLLNTDIAVAIGRQLRDALDEALPRHLAAAASPLAERVTEMIEMVSRQSRDGVGEMIQAFGERLEGATHARLGALAGTLERLTGALDGAARRMDQGGDDLGQALKGAASQLAATVEGVRDTVSALAERMRAENETGQALLQEQMARTAESMSAVVAQLGGAVEEGAARAREGAGKATASLIDRVGEAADRLGSVAAGIEAAVAQASERAQVAIRDAAESTARELGGAGAQAAGNMFAIVETMRDRIEILGEQLAKTANGLRELEARLAAHSRAISEAESGTKAVAGALAGTATGIRAAVTEAGEGLRAAAQPLLVIGERVAQATEAARRSNEGLERLLAETVGQARRQTEATERALDQLDTVWQRHVERFDGVDTQLGKAFEEIGAKLRENLGHLAEFSEKIDNHTSKAVGHFSGAIEELAEIGAEISKGVQALNGQGPGRRA